MISYWPQKNLIRSISCLYFLEIAQIGGKFEFDHIFQALKIAIRIFLTLQFAEFFLDIFPFFSALQNGRESLLVKFEFVCTQATRAA